MQRTPRPQGQHRTNAWARGGLGAATVLALALVGCSGMDPQRAPGPPAREAGPAAPGRELRGHANAAAPKGSLASSAADYRTDAARHVYAQQNHKVFPGRLPPMLYAVGVLNVDIDRQGRIQALRWSRAPRHAPEVVAEIERMVHAAAPFPAPTRLGQVTYTDVWLWDKSGRFQLDTLTEGQD